jgi:Protein of unknown function (DUF2939)
MTLPAVVKRLKLGAVASLAGLAMLGACVTSQTLTAVDDVRGLALALQARDSAGIESRIDRAALRAQIVGLGRAYLLDQASRAEGFGQLAATAAYAAAEAGNPLVERAADAILSPRILADIGRRAGLTPDRLVPGRGATSVALRQAGPDRVCLPDPDQVRRCLLYFTPGPAGWRLSAIDETALRARFPDVMR